MTNPSLAKSPNVDDWIAIGADGRVRVRSGKLDIGQRISTSIAILAGEELSVPAASIIVEERVTGPTPDEGMTTGSNSIEHSGAAVRRAAATARAHLIALAAERLGADADQLGIEDGLIRDPASNRSVTLGELQGGKPFGIPVDENAALKPPDAYTQIGKAADTATTLDLATGRTRFVHDMTMEGLWHARVVRPPHSLARLRTLDPAAEEKLAALGVKLLRDGSFLAVVGADEFAVIKGAERLAALAEWDLGEGLDDRDIFETLTGNPRLSFPVIDGTPQEAPVPELAEPPEEAETTLSARYERPYQMHGSIGPSAALAVSENGKLELWTHCQGIYPLREIVAASLDMGTDDVTIHHALGAGCYGHNGADDAAFEAAVIARAFPGTPVLLKWTREDEHAWEPYTSAMALKLRASLNGDGKVIDWSAEVYSDAHTGRPRIGADRAGVGRLLANQLRGKGMASPEVPPNFNRHSGMHRNLEPDYDFPRTRLVKNLVRGLPLRTSAMRGLGAAGNIFALECFMDELAEEAGADALGFRLDHLADLRARAVLESAANGIGWGGTVDENEGLGLAYARYKNVQTYAAVGVALAVDDAANVRLIRAVVTADAGEVIDPSGLRAQLEGGFVQAASWALYEQVVYSRDGIESRDWESYPVLRFDNVPEVEVVIIDRPGEKSMGAGEASSAPAVAAIANAIHAATGLRLRRMPFTPDALRAAAIAE